MAQELMIVSRDLCFSYPESDHALFSHINFSIDGQGFFSLFGFSGSGKSTLARLIGGLLKPDSGSILRSGLEHSLFSYNTERLPGWITVREHLEDVAPPGRSELLLEIVSELDIVSFMDHKFPRLSMGQKNRVNFARYLLQDFDLLIADEVLANVDEPSRTRILAFMKRRYPEKMFIYISHNAREVAVFSKQVLVIPQAGANGITGLISLSGMDLDDFGTADKTLVQNKMIEILQASSRAV